MLTGGSSPGRAYERAAELEPDWSRVSLWWGDERCVPPDDERSNYALAERTLLARLDQQPDEVHRIRGELQPADAAGELAKTLEGETLDLLLLGLGPDAHVASLFPGSPQLLVRERLATSGPARLEPFVDRVTLTLPALLGASRIVFLVTGEAKAEAVARAFRDEIDEDAPGSLLRRSDAPLEVYLDIVAASLLDSSGSSRP